MKLHCQAPRIQPYLASRSLVKVTDWALFCLFMVFLQSAEAADSVGVYQAPTTNTASISVETKKILGKVSPYLFGHNQLGYQVGTYKTAMEPEVSTGYGIWDPDLGKPNTAMLDLAKSIRMSVCRWPGGCGSHNFQWKKAIGPVTERPGQRFGLPEFLVYCEAVGAKPIITVAEYWGEAQDGADLVEYLNAPDDGKHPTAITEGVISRDSRGSFLPQNTAADIWTTGRR